MQEALDEGLRGLLRTMVAGAPGRRIPFIVTLRPGVHAASLVPFPIEQDFALIRAVSGTMTPAEALALSEHPDVERIEYDGQLHALIESSDPKES